MDKKTGKVITAESRFPTPKNEEEFRKKEKSFEYLANKASMISPSGDFSSHYRTEYRTKKNGSKRRLDVPDEELMKYQREVVKIFTTNLNFLFPNSVHGYVTGRNSKSLAKEHRNQYQIIKVDIKDFFSSCTYDFVMNSITEVYPFNLVDFDILETIIRACMVFYDGKFRLPRGAPTSPLLSNIAMIPIDYDLQYSRLFNRNPYYDYTYTRYADDIFISHATFKVPKYSLEEQFLAILFGETIEEESIPLERDSEIIKRIIGRTIKSIEKCLKEHNQDFELNKSKTKIRYLTHGNVWMLRVTVGSDVKIGNKKKQKLKASLWSFLMDCKNGKPWTKKQTQKLIGKLGYAKYIEPKFVTDYVAKYERKSGMNFRNEIKKILC